MKQYFAFQWHITDDCDQRCKHCYIFAENNCKALDSMTWDEMQQVVANCEDFCETYRRAPYFYITGGDPILHKDFWKLMELMKEKGYPFTIMGNPFHLTPEVCSRLKECGCQKYQIPENVDPDMIYGGCNCGNCHITITPTGDVYACRRVQNSRVACIFEERLADIWVNQMEDYRQFDRFRKCAKCELLAWCRGCPAVASGARGDFYDADPQCWKEAEGSVLKDFNENVEMII